MKKIIGGLTFSLGIILFVSCSKNDCVCTSTSAIDGVVQSTSSTSSGGTGVPGPAGAAGNSDLCNSGDYSSTYTSGGSTYSDITECELE